MYLISAYFDENTNKILKHLQQRIADKTGNDFMIRNNVMPHLTISAIEARNVDVADAGKRRKNFDGDGS